MIYQVDANGNRIEDAPDQPSGGGLLRLPGENMIFYAGGASVVLMLFGGPLAIVLGCYVYLRAKNAIAIYEAEPKIYDPESVDKVRSGRTCGIIAVVGPIIMVILFFLIWGLICWMA